MNSTATVNKNKNAIMLFFKSIDFIDSKLTKQSKELIHKKVLENKLKGYFENSFWRGKSGIQSIFNITESIIFLEYTSVKYIDVIFLKNKTNIFNILVYYKFLNKEYLSALKLINKIESFNETDTDDYINTLNYKGTIYKLLGRYNEALEAYYEAIRLISGCEKTTIDEKELKMSNVYNNIGILYRLQNDLESAEKIFKKSTILNEHIQNKPKLLICYANLANIYDKKNEYKKAIAYLLKAKDCRSDFSDTNAESVLNINLATIYLKINDFDLAQKYLNKCKTSTQKSIKQEIVLLELSIVMKQLEKLEKNSFINKKLANDLIEKSLKIAKEEESIVNKMSIYSLIADAYLVIENFKQANIMLTRRNMLFKQLTEQQKIDSYKQIRESHELELQKKELEKKEQLLQQKETLNKKQKQINTELELFASMASYDLKAPIRTILALCSIIKNQNLAKTEMNEYLTLIKIDAQKMNNLINSLLKYAKIGYKNVEFKKIALKTTVNTVKRNLATEIKNKNAIISLEKLPEINGNKALLEQLFQNLINNALIYNENQKPEITIRSTKNQNEIEIVDNGIGIPKNRINQIFKAFTRAHSASKYGGSGVGLAICKKIMDIHFGSISVSSKQGKGTCFTLTFK